MLAKIPRFLLGALIITCRTKVVNAPQVKTESHHMASLLALRDWMYYVGDRLRVRGKLLPHPSTPAEQTLERRRPSLQHSLRQSGKRWEKPP
uniref:Putative secreted protein n=1 Tax=Ixodes ricinus TaxID=34613 RepID=A0A6B0U4B1_IXORI